ncbi:MAG: MBOAT family protein [Planctomycetota bacterium]|nr:MBOAT family protein [Planctomycetota bacterium]
MLFSSLEFWVFFAAVFGLYVALNHRGQNAMLLAASYLFYSWWGQQGFDASGVLVEDLHGWADPLRYRFAALMFATAAFDWYAGLKIHAATETRARRFWLVLSLGSNLAVLGFFKYCNFFLANTQALLHALGFSAEPFALKIILPVAISFYTFQSMAYTIDIYRNELKPTRNLWDFMLFVAYFPHLVAGPINRPQGLLSQCERPRRMTWDGWRQGATLILIGLFRKVVVADSLAPLAEKAFVDPTKCSSLTLLLGLYCYAFQIYADFSGYTDIARGLAKLMGFELMHNFHQPYFAANITDFWRRWHLSLSTWLRDYLYIPLGGNRHGNFKTYRNLFLTMLLGGLWHGASWTFVVWGALHGLYLAAHKWMLGDRKPSADPPPAGAGWGARLVFAAKACGTFHLVALAWIFFRAPTFAGAWNYLAGLAALRGKFAKSAGGVGLDSDDLRAASLAVAAMLLLIDLPQYLRKDHTRILAWPFAARVAGFALLALWLIALRRTGEHVPFIYFQF